MALSVETTRSPFICTDITHSTNNLILPTMAYLISDGCIACGTCIDECPTASISEGEIYVINPDTCIDCSACADVCPTGVISPA